MIKITRNIFWILCLLLFAGTLFAEDPIADRFMSAANDQYSAGNYEKAYEYINKVLAMYRGGLLPENAAVMAEMIYYSYLQQLRTAGDEDNLDLVKVWLQDFPAVESSRIRTLIASFEKDIEKKEKEIAAAQAAEVQAAKAASASSGGGVAHDDTLLKELAATIEKEAEMLSQVSSQNETFQRAMELSSQQSENMNKTILLIVLGVGCALIIVFIVIIIGVVVSAKNSKRQQEQFAATLQVVAEMSRIPSEHLMLDGVTGVYGDSQLRLVGSSSVNANGLPEPEVDEKEMQLIREFAVRCEQIGNEIDVMTGRKNNSKNISEMVYKISMELGIRKDTAMLYFCAAMVYDIGFLELDKDLLQADSLTEEQKYSIRAHVKPASDAFDFIPEKYRSVFKQAAATHHENMDGSGYPSGLVSSEIPEIARMIHVVESFVSLISRRNYRAIYDKESAVQELMNHPELYDESIVKVLDSIV